MSDSPMVSMQSGTAVQYRSCCRHDDSQHTLPRALGDMVVPMLIVVQALATEVIAGGVMLALTSHRAMDELPSPLTPSK